ncbi:MAG: TIR domain-containing protein [Acidobacteriota bacterium]|nr:TIR domain-containing protein [Acidobacteriota bacterium]
MAHDVFISYSTADKPVADVVCAGLEQRGFSCWVAPRDIVPGLDWGAAIIDAINDAKVMVLIFSSSANTSKQIKREVERAVSKGVTLIPLRIEDVPLGKTLEYFISSEHWMDALSRPLEPHVDRLADAIRALLARPSKSIDTGVRIARKASGAHPAAASLPEPQAPAHAQPHAQPAVPPGVSRPGKFRPIPLAATGAVLIGVLVALGVFKASPPQILSVQFPARIWANATRASGVIFFRTKKSDVASARFDVVSAASFPPISFSVQGVEGRREGSFGFYLQTGTPQRITLKAVITDRAGHDSNPVPFTFEAVPVPVAPAAPPPAPVNRGRRGRVDVQVPNFHFRVR